MKNWYALLDKEAWREALAGEALLLGLVGKILYLPPDRSLVDSLIDEDIFAETPFGMDNPEVQRGLATLQAWSQQNHPALSDEAFGDLQVDYTHLFIGVGKVRAPIWESVYFSDERLLFQEQTVQVRDWYRRYGLQVEKKFQEPDDHLGLELAFITHLVSLAIQALEEQDETRFNELIEAQRAFLEKHPLRWASQWSAQVEEFAKTGFYRGIARLANGGLVAAGALLEVAPNGEVQR